MDAIGRVQRNDMPAAYGFAPQDRRELQSDSDKGQYALASAKEEKAKFDYSALNEEEKKKLEENLKKINDSLVSYGKTLKFKYDDEAKMTYVEVIDTESQEVVASLPPEFLIDLSVRMKELIGMFIDKQL
jgi:flagellar protein FlaG